MNIYTAPNYSLSVAGDTATLTNGKNTQTMPLRHGDDTIPAGLAAALKKAGQDPADYFAVAGRYVIRRAALQVWSEAVEARIAERHAEKAAADAALAADIAARGQRALVLHGSYLLNSSLVFVRPMEAAEAEKFAPEFRASGKLAMGEWTSIAAPVAQAFLAGRERQNDGWLNGQESVVILITDAEWEALLSGEAVRVEAARAARAEKEVAEAARIETSRQQAEQTGEPVEIGRFMDECDGTEQDCSFDLIRRMVRGDGSRFTLRTHCH
jgi:hypothetical protein